MKLNIGLTGKQCEGVVQILNILLADEYLLFTKTFNYHWNVTGPQFNDLHKFLGAQYQELVEIVDEVAERAHALGGKAIGTLAEFVKNTRLKEQPNHYLDAKDMLTNLLSDHEAVIRSQRVDLETCSAKHHDAGTADFLTGLMEKHEKMAWMLRSYLEGKSV